MNASLTLIELIDLLAESTSTTPRMCELFLRELFATASQELIKGNTVCLKNIGSFRALEYKSKSKKKKKGGKSKPASKPPHRWIVFTPAKSLADAVNQPFAQFETVILDDALTDEQLAAIDKRYPSLALDTPIEEIKTRIATSNEPNEPAEPAEPAESSEPTEPSEPADPSEPTEPSEPAEPTEPSEHTEPSEPTEPSEFPETSDTSLTSEDSKSQDEPAGNHPVERKPMLVGIPIDGPSHPVPEHLPVEEPKTDEYFYRPALRDAYSPTEEQLSTSDKRGIKWWKWALPAVVLVTGIVWLALSHSGSTTTNDNEAMPMDTAELYVEEPNVVTDTVTSQIVLSILAEKHYHSSWFWVYIYEENKDKISDPDNVRPGTVVVIPPAEKYGIDAKDPASLKKAQRRSWEILKLGKR